ncbi:hypothetical protein GF382_01210 [Candidatus Falkowbacteria bacterium]|nr:hypothetical protein [Candidatus Falkowbacteria bacterium]
MRKFAFIILLALCLAMPALAKKDLSGAREIFDEIGLEMPVDWGQMSRQERFDHLEELGLDPGEDGKYRGDAGDLDEFFRKLGKEQPENWGEMSFEEKKAFVSGSVDTKELPSKQEEQADEKNELWRKFPPHTLFARVAWILIFVILIMRPFFQVIGWEAGLSFLFLRKYLGWAAGLSAFLHVALFLNLAGKGLDFFLIPRAWDLKGLFGWGTLALLSLLLPFLTSNLLSQKILKRNWKRIQNFSYLAFIFTGVHIYIAKGGINADSLLVAIWLIFFVSAFLKNRRYKNNQ